MDLELEGKSVLICGGGSGIGHGCALAFAREGARVAVLDRNADSLTGVADELRALGAEAITLRADVSSAADVERAHAEVIAQFGGIDVALNNAGVVAPSGPIEDSSEADWNRVLGVNLTGVWLCVREQVRHMRPRGSGVIVNTASAVAFVGAPGTVAYNASKHGVIGITQSVGLELASSGVRINAVAPGSVETPLAHAHGRANDPFADALVRQVPPIGRRGFPAEIADAVLWLASARSSFALGSTLVVDGGLLAQ